MNEEGTIIASVTYYADKAHGGQLYKVLITNSLYKDMSKARHRQRQRRNQGAEFKDGWHVIRRPDIDEAEFQKYVPMSRDEFNAQQGTRFYDPKTAQFNRVVKYA